VTLGQSLRAWTIGSFQWVRVPRAKILHAATQADELEAKLLNAQTTLGEDLRYQEKLEARIERVTNLANALNRVPAYSASEYDRGRVEQRNDDTGDLFTALEDLK